MFKKIAIVGATLFVSLQAQATPLYSNAGFVAGDKTITFNEVAVVGGTAVTNQFNASGVSFTTNGPGPWFASNNPGPYSTNPGFAGTYLDNFTGGGAAASIYNILFSSTVKAAGAMWEFNISSPAATFSAYLNGALVETFNYNNVACCTSTQFIGFSNTAFNEIRISNITGVNFIMDTLQYSPASHVPVPGSLALISLGLVGAIVSRRRSYKKEVATAFA